MKSVQIWSFYGPYFSMIGLNTEIYGFSPNIGKYRPEKTPYLDIFHAASSLKKNKKLSNSLRPRSKLFHSIMVDEKKKFFKKLWFVQKMIMLCIGLFK